MHIPAAGGSGGEAQATVSTCRRQEGRSKRPSAHAGGRRRGASDRQHMQEAGGEEQATIHHRMFAYLWREGGASMSDRLPKCIKKQRFNKKNTVSWTRGETVLTRDVKVGGQTHLCVLVNVTFRIQRANADAVCSCKAGCKIVPAYSTGSIECRVPKTKKKRYVKNEQSKMLGKRSREQTVGKFTANQKGFHVSRLCVNSQVIKGVCLEVTWAELKLVSQNLLIAVERFVPGCVGNRTAIAT
jgi:hypothetical protein